MKKFTLSVSEPCHEDWSKMTPDERGRFCGSCQKNVVDFTNMSDRQLAEFFKKPTGSVCGRFHKDQLDRPIEVPKKRVPWVRYFFQFTWPAFVLFLKSCGQRAEVVGELEMRKTETVSKEPLILGALTLPKITPVDTNKVVKVFQPVIKGNIGSAFATDSSIKVMGDTTAVSVLSRNLTTATDTIEKIAVEPHCQSINDENTDNINVTLGGGIAVAVAKINNPLPTKVIEAPAVDNDKVGVLLYPNPIARGQLLTVKVEEKLNGHYEVLTVSGQILHTQRLSPNEKQAISVNTSSWPGGTYFLRLVDEDAKRATTQKFIVQ